MMKIEMLDAQLLKQQEVLYRQVSYFILIIISFLLFVYKDHV